MKTNRILHIRFAILATIMIVSGGWNDLVWGQNSITISSTPISTDRIYTIPYAIVMKQDGNYENKYKFNIQNLLESHGLTELGVSNIASLANGFYVRWYVRKKSDNTFIDLTNWSLDNNNKLYKYQQGFAWSTNEKNQYYTEFLNFIPSDLLNITIIKPNDISWLDYEIICDISHTLTNLAAGTSSGSITQEPDIELRYIFDITTPNIATLSTNNPAKIYTIPYSIMEETVKSIEFNLINRIEANISDFGNNIAVFNDLNGSFYIRWYLKNKNNVNSVDLTSWILKNNNKLFKYPQGFAWSTNETDSWYKINDNKEGLLSINLEKPNDVLWSDYELICDLSHDISNLGASSEKGGIYQEPAIQVRYIFDISSPSINTLGTLSSESETFTIKKYIPDYDFTANYFSVNKDLISQYLNQTEDVWFTDLYTRWYLEDKTTGASIPISGWTFKNEDSRFGTYQYPQGFVYFTGHATNEVRNRQESYMVGNALTAHITRPEEINWENIKVVCLATNNLTGIVAGETMGSITAEPSSFNMKFEFIFDLNENMGFTHNYRPGNTATTTVYNEDQVDVYNGISYQKTSKWTYDVFVMPGESVNLVLPIEDIFNANGSIRSVLEGHAGKTEPHAYYRWFDYKTDQISPNLSLYSGNLLQRYQFGFMAYNYEAEIIGSDLSVVTFTAPTDFTEAEIACEVSDYHDYILGETFTEPTLATRYIFKIRRADSQAEQIKQEIINVSFYEKNAYVTLNCKDDKSEFTLRTENRFPYDYNYYSLLTTNFNNISEASFGTELIKGQSIIWFVKDDNNIVYAFSNAGSDYRDARFFNFTKEELNIDYNKNFEVFGVVVNSAPTDIKVSGTGAQTLWNNLSQFTFISYNICQFKPDRPAITMTELHEGDAHKYRTYEFLYSKYQLASEINFDNIDEAGTVFNYSAPSAENNMRPYPHDVVNTSYGYVYPSLTGVKTWYHFRTWARNHSPVHGEYSFYKSANLENVSTDNENYSWWYTSTESTVFYDRTYHTSNGEKYGYFMYTDASEESRPLATIEVDSELCVGSSLIFTAWIADISGVTAETPNPVKPQVMFKIYGVDRDTNAQTLLQSTLSEVIPGRAEWMQVYTDVVLQSNIANTSYDFYRVSIDNYSKGTKGADYAIDDIRMFIKTSQIEIIPQRPYCEGETTIVKVEAAYDEITTKLGISNSNSKVDLRYYIVDEKGQRVQLGTSDNYLYATLDGNYASDIIARPNSYETRNGTNYFILDKELRINIEPNTFYYLIVDYKATTSSVWITSNLGDVCSIFSDPFKMGRATIEIEHLDGNTDVEISIDCGEDTKLINEMSTYLSIPNSEGGIDKLEINFDWYMRGIMPSSLVTALKNLRASYPASENGAFITGKGNDIDWNQVNAIGYLSTSDLSTLLEYKDDMIFNQRVLDNIVLVSDINLFSAIPVELVTSNNGQDIYLCEDLLEVSVVVSNIGGPSIDLGFYDINYEAIGDGANSIRLGLKQFENIQNGSPLLVPIKNFANEKDKTAEKKADIITIDGNDYLNLIETNDPIYNNDVTAKALIESGTYAIGKISSLDTKRSKGNTEYSVTFLFKDNNLITDFKVHEGYWYKVKFDFTNDEGADNCNGSSVFTIKVVPEYLTFSDERGNWNTDTNWIRSTKTILYKDIESQNSDSYSNYPLVDGDELIHQGYVPMKFTKVTITKEATPQLYALTNDATTGTLNMTLNNQLDQQPTEFIEYDMMVKSAATNGYDCEKFYSNTCEQIYFKPEAEMLAQHLLTYEKAWVDFELTANRWYMLGSPLKGVVAGDMYLPLANRRQETEAFQPITFDNTLVKHNRAKLPVYQRSWDQDNSLVLKPDGNTYDAYKGKVANWSHVYNDVEVDYSVQGFSIKADKKDGNDVKVMFRIPKADDKYRYFSYCDESSTPVSPTNEKTIVRSEPSKLRTDGATDGVITVALATNADANNELYLMCNPYMATLDMTAFFAANTHLEAKYWTIAEGKQSISSEITTLGDVKPLQAFLVKPITKTAVNFNPGMTKNTAQTTRTTTRSSSFDMPCLRITASSNNSESTALLLQADWADNRFADREDTEALFDSNLKDHPTVYTIAGQQATSINTVADVEAIALGIYQNSEEPTTIKFDGMDSFDYPLYIYDAETEESKELTSTTSIIISSSTSGRYFILNKEIHDSKANNLLQISVSNQVLHLSMPNGELIDNVMLFDLNGYLLKHELNINNADFRIDVYEKSIIIVKTQTTSGVFIEKIFIK